jgi:fatty-acid desaturase
MAETAAGSPSASAAGSVRTLDYPEETKPIRVVWSYAIALSLAHLFSLLAVLPWLFSWSGLVLAVLGHFTFGMLGITIGYHRLLTHRGFQCPKWFEHGLALLGLCNLQDSPARWVAIHRMHHQHSDHQPDPHSPLVDFLWGHVGWVVVRDRRHDTTSHFERYARDLLRDPFYLRLERHGVWLLVFLTHAMLFGLAGLAVGAWLTGSIAGGYQLAASWIVWGVFVRTVFVLHGTWAVNSLTHLWGYRTYQTRDNSRNNWLVALLSHGEGWHNNHHAQPRAARHGHHWWEYDMSWWVIWCWEKIGLVRGVVRPSVGGAMEESVDAT